MISFLKILLMAVCLLISGLSSQTLTNGYGGLKWGSTISEVKQKYSITESKSDEPDVRIFMQDCDDENGIKGRGFYFFDDKLFRVTVICAENVDLYDVIPTLEYVFGDYDTEKSSNDVYYWEGEDFKKNYVIAEIGYANLVFVNYSAIFLEIFSDTTDYHLQEESKNIGSGGNVEKENANREAEIIYKNGEKWYCYDEDDITILLALFTSKSYGKWYEVDFIITNKSNKPITFNPKENIITFFCTTFSGEKHSLNFLSYEEYYKKVRRRQNWNAFFMSNYSESTTNTTTNYSGYYNNYNSYYSGSANSESTTSYYDPSKAERNNAILNSYMDDRKSIQQNYLKENTVYPNKTIKGYLLSKKVKCKDITLVLKINDKPYVFYWK